MPKPWVRLYRNALSKPKIGKLCLSDLGFWCACLMLSDDEGQLPAVSDMAWSLHLNDAEVEARIATLECHALVTRDVTRDGHAMSRYRLHDWDEHQCRSDADPTAKTRKKRQRDRSKNTNEVKELDNVTDVSRVTSRKRHASGHANVTRTDTDTDIEYNIYWHFEKFWKAFPRTPNMSKSEALKAFKKQARDLPGIDILLKAVGEYAAWLKAESKRWGKPVSPKHAQGWLNEKRWQGFTQEPQDGDGASSREIDWGDSIPAWAALKMSLKPQEWKAWFSAAKLVNTTLFVKTEFEAQKIRERYHREIAGILGEDFEVKVLPQTEPRLTQGMEPLSAGRVSGEKEPKHG